MEDTSEDITERASTERLAYQRSDRNADQSPNQQLSWLNRHGRELFSWLVLIAVVALCWVVYLHDGPSSLALVAGAMVLWPAAFFVTNVIVGARRSAGAQRGGNWLFPIVSCLAAPLLVWSALNTSFDAQYWDWHSGLILAIWTLIVCGHFMGRLIARRRRSLNPNPRALKK